MIKKVEHIALVIKDIDKSIEYYSRMFNFELRARGKNERREMAFIRHKDQPDFEIELIKDLVDLGTYSEQGIVNHLAFTVENLDEAISHYKKQGVTFNSEKPNIAIDGAKTIFFYGPDRELLQFVQPVNR